ncbi:MAG TPA: hypothetical protein VFT59_05630 [Candidatus Saccharimonadales bacterium]|nr:hypothetical protein [Candidatus Saccharimonadales bacterium]
MDKYPTLLFTRAFSYIVIFALGTGIIEFLHLLVPNQSFILGASIIMIFALIGCMVICEKNILSRITSAFTLLVLAVVAIRFDHTPLPSIVFLLLALVIAYIGALPHLHISPRNANRLVLYASGIIVTSLIFVAALTYITTVFLRMATTY